MEKAQLFLEPLDVLFLRGNKLFGDPGSFGESLVPPWPSVAAGALRSRILADDGVDPAAFARGDFPHSELGTPNAPGAFTVAAFHLARRLPGGRVELLAAPPADLVVSETADGAPGVKTLNPIRLPAESGLISSAPLPLLPVLAQTGRGKPARGYWLTESGWKRYLSGETPRAEDLVKSDRLWKLDHRVGIGLDAGTRSASEGRLFSMQAVAMVRREHSGGDGFDVGFLAAVIGAQPPKDGIVRLGGDGRAAAVGVADITLPEPDYATIADGGRCRLVLTTPGLFEKGWLPTGITRTEAGEYRFDLHGVRGRLVSAAVPRAEVVSGWDLARRRPKPALRAAPTGSVFWLEDLDATPDALRKLSERGLWSEPEENAVRRAEGFNRVQPAAWRGDAPA